MLMSIDYGGNMNLFIDTANIEEIKKAQAEATAVMPKSHFTYAFLSKGRSPANFPV